MTTVVQKYGGSSVADIARLRLVGERVVRTVDQGHRVVVVVSAMGKTTDELIALARGVTESPPRRELDMLLTCGERISMSLLSMVIHELGREAISFTGSQSGIITDDRHSGARILEVRPFRIHEELERGKIVIIAGFQGVSLRREVTTLGRGGSDTTAVAMAAALGAEYCEICSDVDGVLTADPNIVPEARKLDAISYEEMQELAIHGAKVLNAQAVEWARRAGIRIAAVATAGGGTGTQVVELAPGKGVDAKRRATGVTGSKDLTRVTLRGGADRLVELLKAFDRDGIAPRSLDRSEAETVVTFGRIDLPDWAAVRRRLGETFGNDLSIEDHLGSVSVVGHGVGSDPTLALDVTALAAGAGAVLRGINASPLRLTLLVDVARVDELVRTLHDALGCGSAGK